MPKEFFIEQPTHEEIESKLKELKEYPELRPRLTVAWPVSKEKGELLKMVNAEEITEKKDIEKVLNIVQGPDIVEKKAGLYLLKKLNHPQKNTNFIFPALNKILNKIKEKREAKKTYPKWLATRKPLFATPHIPELAEKLSLIDEAVKTLENKYKDKFIGLIVFGSSYKGYWDSKSDIDYMFSGLEDNREIYKQFKELTKNIHFCPCFSEYSSYQELTATRNIARIFHGIFFGNREKLLEIQNKVLSNIDEAQWDDVREYILNAETNLEKAQKRFRINDERLKQIEINIALLRVPPPLEEAKKIISQRYEQEQKQEMEKNKQGE